MQTMPHNSPGTLVFWRRKSQQNSNRVIPNGGAKCRWGGLNAGAVAENWQLPTWSIINLAQSQVCHTEHPRYLFTARHAGLSATARPCLLPSTCCRTELLEMSGIGCYRLVSTPVIQPTVLKHCRELRALTAANKSRTLTALILHWSMLQCTGDHQSVSSFSSLPLIFHSHSMWQLS